MFSFTMKYNCDGDSVQIVKLDMRGSEHMHLLTIFLSICFFSFLVFAFSLVWGWVGHTMLFHCNLCVLFDLNFGTMSRCCNYLVLFRDENVN